MQKDWIHCYIILTYDFKVISFTYVDFSYVDFIYMGNEERLQLAFLLAKPEEAYKIVNYMLTT